MQCIRVCRRASEMHLRCIGKVQSLIHRVVLRHFFRPSLPPPSAQHCSKVCPGLPHLGFVHWTVDLVVLFDFDTFDFCISLQLGLLDLANMAVTPFSCCICFSSWRICNTSVLVASFVASVTVATVIVLRVR